MGINVNIGEAKTRLSELVAASIRGEDVILARAGTPVARIVALDDAKAVAKAERAAAIKAWIGSKKGMVDPDIDWFEPTYTDEEIESFTLFPGEKPGS